VDAINFDVRDGEFFGFLGPNGAGKTTTMRMIAGVSPRTAGTLSILGSDPDTDGPRIRGQIGVVHQQETLDQELTVRENLLVFGRFFGLAHKEIAERADQLLELFQLSDRAKDQVEPLSGGMKRRLSIARSLINAPRVLMLDEPTTGLDPQARHLLWDALQRLKRAGTTIVLTTHYMDEAEQLCDRLVVMDQAKIVAEGSPRQLIEQHASREVLELRFPDGTSALSKAALEGIGAARALRTSSFDSLAGASTSERGAGRAATITRDLLNDRRLSPAPNAMATRRWLHGGRVSTRVGRFGLLRIH
jgi:lipooligosaccharide transport system ATP-binding protein